MCVCYPHDMYVVHAICRLGCPFKLYVILEQDTGCLSGMDGKCKCLFSLSHLVSPLPCLFLMRKIWACKYSEELVL